MVGLSIMTSTVIGFADIAVDDVAVNVVVSGPLAPGTEAVNVLVPVADPTVPITEALPLLSVKVITGVVEPLTLPPPAVTDQVTGAPGIGTPVPLGPVVTWTVNGVIRSRPG